MSLLRSVLKKNSAQSSPKGFDPGAPSKKSFFSAKSSAASFKSVASTIQSIASFYSTLTHGGTQVPKRRKPDWSKLGEPVFYSKDPPPAELPEGVERVPPSELEGTPSENRGISLLDADEEPWLSTVLYSNTVSSTDTALYHNQGIVRGEVRLSLKKPDSIQSIDVWLIVRAESVLDIMGPNMFQAHVNVWSPAHGDPTLPSPDNTAPPVSFKKKIPAGTYVFPFTFPAFPQDVHVIQGEEITRKNKGEVRVDLPPSYKISAVGGFTGSILYKVGVDVKRGILGLDDDLDLQFSYFPRTRPIPRPITPFPLLPTREDWPFKREVVGGWVLTPFGGRGRFRDEMVELEGILGVQSPPVHASTPKGTVPFTLILHCSNPTALAALADPSSIKVAFMRSEVYGPDALAPRTASRKNRVVTPLAYGKIWKAEIAKYDDIESSVFPNESSPPGLTSIEEEADVIDEVVPIATTEIDAQLGSPNLPEPSTTLPSPTPSLEDLSNVGTETMFPGEEDAENIVMLHGEVPIAKSIGLPSFRYQYMSREYMIKIVVVHNEYSHITPAGPGPYCESPLWVVSDPPRAEGEETLSSQSSSSSSSLSSGSTASSPIPETVVPSSPILTSSNKENTLDAVVKPNPPTSSLLPTPPPSPSKTTPSSSASLLENVSSISKTKLVDVGPGAIYAPEREGKETTRTRPTWRAVRMAAF